MQLIPSSVMPDYTNEQLSTAMFCVFEFMTAYLFLSINANYISGLMSVSSRGVFLKLEKRIAVLNSVSIVIK